MKPKFMVPLLLAAGALAAGATMPTSDQAGAPCLDGRRAALIQGGFTGPLVCSPRDASFILVGHTAGHKFSIYDYRYRYLPEHGNVMHGSQKIVVFRGKIYVGQYALSPPPYAAIALHGARVALRNSENRKPTVVDFSREPPGKIFFDGYDMTFGR